MNTLLKPVICPKCGWNHFGVDREYAERQAIEFLEYYNSMEPEQREQYYGARPHTYDIHMHQYEHCFRCGNNYKNLVAKEEFTSPLGSTLQPIIFPDQ